MKKINVIIRGNLICSGDITPTPDGGVSAFCCPADVVLPKIFRHGETIYDITNAVVINGDVRANSVTSLGIGGVLVTGNAMMYNNGIVDEWHKTYPEIEIIES
ncbi:hypothetical protein [Paramuribaculum intestinale]|uniref:hypothetical protein n=1 Tax=Paramuribaculum intestinale TaxID=2094151 RepID=UPI0025A9A945|nr:hypothetical protein [Paramuribaculum intestinale]